MENEEIKVEITKMREKETMATLSTLSKFYIFRQYKIPMSKVLKFNGQEKKREKSGKFCSQDKNIDRISL